MPRRRFQKKRPIRKRQTRRKKKNVTSNMLVQVGPRVIPDRYRCKMNYTTCYQTSTGVLSTTLYRANSVYDPIHAAGGGQPMGFDELATLYGRYMVRGCSIRVTAVNRSSETVRICVVPSPDVTTVSSFQQAVEWPYSKTVTLGANTKLSRSINHYATTKAVRGIRGPLVDDELEALVTANPTKGWYWHLITTAFNGASAIALDVEISLTYYVDFFKRTPLNLS